jgi:hypothetical protein
VKPEEVILAYEDALKALDPLVQAQWAMVSWEAKILDDHGELRSVYLSALARWWSFDWKRGEPWEHYVTRSSQVCKESLQHFKLLLDQRLEKPEPTLYICLDAVGPHPYVEKIEAFHQTYFARGQALSVDAETQSVPLVMAKVRKSTHSFSQGQKIYIYDVYWGVNERAHVIGQFRRKHRWIKGTCPIASLENFRPTEVFHPAVITKLVEGGPIHRGLFERFFPLPQ